MCIIFGVLPITDKFIQDGYNTDILSTSYKLNSLILTNKKTSYNIIL